MPDIHIHIHIQPSDEISNKLDAILTQLTKETKDIDSMKQTLIDALNTLQGQVTAETTADASAVLLIQGVAKQISDLQVSLEAGDTDQDTVAAQLGAFSTTLNDNASKLAAAVTANTPAAPPPAPTV